MTCNCNNTADEPKIKHVQGNVLNVAIPLDVINNTTVDGEVVQTKTEFSPNTSYPVTVMLNKGATRYPFNADVDGNVVSFSDGGTLPVGVYEVEVLCRNDEGNPMRYMVRSAIEIVDATADAGIEPDVEFDAESYTLDGGVFIFAKGDKGDGIADITVVESQEDGGYNVITITLTTGEEVIFSVKNGAKGNGISPEMMQQISDALVIIQSQPAHVFLTEVEYQNLAQKDPGTIYFTYEG